jgi:hypothetical protein
MEILGDNDDTVENKEFAYPAELGKILNINTVRNESYCGATNEFIFRKTIENLLEMESLGNDPKETFVLIGWTSICRAELSGLNWTMNTLTKEDRKLLNLKTSDIQNHLATGDEFRYFGTYFISPARQVIFEYKGKEYNFTDEVIEFLVNYIWIDDLEYEKWFVQQEALKNFLTYKGYDFLMFNATQQYNFENFNQWTKNLMKIFDCTKYMDPINFSMCDWVKNYYPNEIMEASHPNKKAHQKFAEYLYQYIIDNDILKNYEYA